MLAAKHGPLIAAIKRSCALKPLEADYQTITLKAGSNILGRNRQTGIRDAKCSKKQLELTVDLEDQNPLPRVWLKVVGLNPCCVNGLMMLQNAACELSHGDVLEMVYGRHRFELVFTPPPVAGADGSKGASLQVENAAPASGLWDSFENGKVVMYTSAGVRASDKIAAYDLDGTLIRTRSGNVFPKSTDDWDVNFPEVRSKLKRLYSDGYKICVFTNQAGIAKGKVKLDDFKQKILRILEKLDVPAQVFIAIENGYYRKPLPGMWELLVEKKNAQIPLQVEKCFYVGDAAGRAEVGTGVCKRRKDHSNSDRFFATNVGISFYTPEEHFLSRKTEPWTKPEFEPSSIDEGLPLLQPDEAKLAADSCEMIIMVGLPGSGKSHFCQQYFAPLDYNIFNADTLGSTQACLKRCESALADNRSVVVDNTNVDVDSRKKFLDLAKRLTVPCRCFVMSVSLAQVKHNIAFRQLTDPAHSKINEMVLNMMKKKYKSPSLEEGFSEIVQVNLKPKFNSAKDKQLYTMYLVEK